MDTPGRDAPPAAPASLLSTRVPPVDGRPAYIVHAPGADVPAVAPACPPDCATCRGRD
jgi:hypothetical protein